MVVPKERSRRDRRLFVVLGVLALFANWTASSLAAESSASPAAAARGSVSRDVTKVLIDAYPAMVRAGADTEHIVVNGNVLPLSDGKEWPTYEERLNHSDLIDQLSQAYPAGCPARVPSGGDIPEEPGRLRDEAFFKAMYGASAAAIQGTLASVSWFGSPMHVTNVNGVAKHLVAVRDDLAQHPEWLKYLMNPGGSFFWRTIEGTKRLSGHSFGIAVDINTKYSDYWRWSKGGYKNRIPCELAAIFERHGFIWGAKWSHFDTMHFEYRPELLRS